MRLRAIEMVATAVPINRMIQVYYEFLSTCYAEHNRSVKGRVEHAWGILSYYGVKPSFHERWKQEGITDLSSADQVEFIFELCVSEMVVRHNNAAVRTGGQQWTLDNLKRFAQQFLVPCHYARYHIDTSHYLSSKMRCKHRKSRILVEILSVMQLNIDP
jgi:hypothetical protein